MKKHPARMLPVVVAALEPNDRSVYGICRISVHNTRQEALEDLCEWLTDVCDVEIEADSEVLTLIAAGELEGALDLAVEAGMMQDYQIEDEGHYIEIPTAIEKDGKTYRVSLRDVSTRRTSASVDQQGKHVEREP